MQSRIGHTGVRLGSSSTRRVCATASLLVGVCALSAFAQEVQLLSPDIAFTATEVFFREPVTYLGTDKRPRSTRVAVKLLMRGEGFYDGATGPHYYLGDQPANAHYTSPDGEWVAVYFYDPVELPLRTQVRIETSPREFVVLNQIFELTRVRWLSRETRERHDLPDLRARLLRQPG